MKNSLKNKRFPYFTIALSLLCIILYLAINIFSDFGPISQEAYEIFGAPFAIDIYRGQYWGVIVNSLLHIYWIQLLIHLSIFFWLGSFIEKRIGPYKLMILGLLASTVTSCIQLTLSDDAGLGLAGVNFSLFGFIVFRNLIDKRFRSKSLKVMTSVMIILFFGQLYLNIFHDWNFGLAAILGGFTWGGLVAFFNKKKNMRWVAPLVFLMNTLSFASLFYAPWSSEWNCAKGVKLHEKGDIERAEQFYVKAIEIDTTNSLASDNLAIIKIDRLTNEAYDLHLNGEYVKARKKYLEILELDPGNKWAKDNLARLP